MPEDLTFTVQDAVDRCVVVQVAGSLDMDTVTELQDALTGLIDQGRPHLIMEVSQVGFCDSMGLNTLLRLLHLSKAAGGSLALVNASPKLQRIMQLTGAGTVLSLHPTVEQALQRIPEP
jgi:anti-anti-sigma factor